MAEPGTSFSQRLQSALVDALLAGIIAFALFSLLLGLRTVDSVIGLTLEPRPQLLAVAVGIVMVGRLLLNLFVWQAEYPITLPFAKLFTSETVRAPRHSSCSASPRSFRRSSLLSAAFSATQPVSSWRDFVLAFLGVGFIRRTIVFFFPNLPYARIFTVGGIAFAVLFPICSYFLEKAFHLGLPLRYLFDLSILVLTYIMLGWGLNVVVGLAGLLDLGYVAFYAVGAYTFALLATHFGLGFWICLPIAGLAAALWGIILGFPVLRLRGDYLAIVTLAFGEIVRIVLLNWTDVTNGPNGVSGIPKPTFFGLPFAPSGGETFSAFFGLKYDPLQGIIFLYYVILVLAFTTNLVTLKLRRLPIGRAWEAMREDQIACRSLGINTTITKLVGLRHRRDVRRARGKLLRHPPGLHQPGELHLHRIRHHPRHRGSGRHGEPARRGDRGDRHGRRLRGASPYRRPAEHFRRGIRSRALPHAPVRHRHGRDHGLAAARDHRLAHAVHRAR